MKTLFPVPYNRQLEPIYAKQEPKNRQLLDKPQVWKLAVAFGRLAVAFGTVGYFIKE
ncbi:hypothetical protein [Brumimicrobium oceani]|uniref:hypothetical protein n=1 Tax=Brumimicrobium oceani TaxID=2100725 RepID=UPI001304DCD5|nr:hypothetical protein [Brumimicrobium oceani]